MSTELLAQLVEMVSVTASEKRLEEPVKVPRPAWMTDGSGGGSATGNPYAAAIGRMMAAAPPPPPPGVAA